MTREEQIDWLCRLRADLNNGIIFTPWNKEFTEALNKALKQEPEHLVNESGDLVKDLVKDTISRQAVLDTTVCDGISCNECSFNTCEDGQSGCLLKERISKLPPVTPQYTDAEIQKMQELEQAEIEKAYELGKADVLDKIRAEIEMYEADCRLQGGTDECEECNSNVFGSVYRIIDKHRSESEDKE